MTLRIENRLKEKALDLTVGEFALEGAVELS